MARPFKARIKDDPTEASVVRRTTNKREDGYSLEVTVGGFNHVVALFKDGNRVGSMEFSAELKPRKALQLAAGQVREDSEGLRLGRRERY